MLLIDEIKADSKRVSRFYFNQLSDTQAKDERLYIILNYCSSFLVALP
ncbi:hypothetical protein [Neobacillus drentensis]|nr:hypothetical protein [Neobacillus drentensis]